MSAGVELENLITDAIERICVDDETTEEVKEYFDNITVKKIIEQSQE